MTYAKVIFGVLVARLIGNLLLNPLKVEALSNRTAMYTPMAGGFCLRLGRSRYHLKLDEQSDWQAFDTWGKLTKIRRITKEKGSQRK